LKSGGLTLAELEEASHGLLFMSESDYPLVPLLWEGEGKEALTAEKLLSLTGKPADTPVEIEDIDEFFHIATREQDWHGEREREEVKRYQELVKLLKDNLSDIQVYRLGKVEIEVFIVGRTDKGDLMGLSTKVIET
jgi:hypothetical protein